MKPKAETKIAKILAAKGQPLTTEEIGESVGGVFTVKVKNTLKKKSQGAKAVFSGKYAVKAYRTPETCQNEPRIQLRGFFVASVAQGPNLLVNAVGLVIMLKQAWNTRLKTRKT